MRLLENLNSSNLNVPAGIKGIEAELKKEFTAAERKAKAQHKASMATCASPASKPAASKKRKQSESTTQAPNINVNLHFGSNNTGGSDWVPDTAQDQPAPAKKPKSTARCSGRGGLSGTRSGSSQPSEKQSTASNLCVESAARPKQTARRSGPPGAKLFFLTTANTTARDCYTLGQLRRTRGEFTKTIRDEADCSKIRPMAWGKTNLHTSATNSQENPLHSFLSTW